MITGFSTENGQLINVREHCIVDARGHQATYLGSVDVRITDRTTDSRWAYHAGTFGDDAYITSPGENHATDCFTHGWAADDISSLTIRSSPPFMPDEEVKLLQHVDMHHEDPLRVFRRTTGPHGLKLLKLHVGFRADSLPAAIWQCQWSNDGAQARNIAVITETPATLQPSIDDGGLQVVRLAREDLHPNRTYGFRWEW